MPFHPKLPFEVEYTKLKFPIYPTVRLDRHTTAYIVGRLCNVFIKQRFDHIGQVLSVRTQPLGALLKRDMKYFCYYDTLKTPLNVEVTLDLLNQAQEAFYDKMKHFYDRTNTKHLWKEKSTSMLLLTVMNCDKVLNKRLPMLK